MAIGRPISLTPNVATKAINSVATANQTEFTVTGGYRINELAVYRNGVRLAQGRDFTANDGTTVTLTNGATVNDVIEFVVFDSFNVADAIVSVASSQTVTGDLNVTGKFYSGSIDPNSLNVAGVGTITRISNTSLVATSATVSSALHVGSALTANAAGDVESIGIITAASFSGDGSALVGLANTDFVVSVATTTGNLNVSAAATITGDLTVSDSIAVTKDINIGAAATITGALSGSTGTFSGAVNVDATTDSTSSTSGALIVDGGLGVAKNVFIGAGLSVAGTLTYEDVTNVDSVGLITAKSGVNITGGELTVGSGITMGIAGVATFSGTSDVHLTDGVKAKFGDSGDLEIFHNGSHSIIADVGTGNLQLRAADFRVTDSTNAEVMIKANTNEAVELYYNHAKKFETTNDGTVTTGIGTFTAGATFGNDVEFQGSSANITFDKSEDDLIFQDNAKAAFGTGSDLQVYFDGTDGYIKGGSSGELVIRHDAITMQAASSTDTYFDAVYNAEVSLRYNNSKKFETTNDGVKITGIATCSNGLDTVGMQRESFNTVANKLSAAPNIDLEQGMIHYFTTTETTTATPNIRYSSTKSLNNMMSDGDAITVTIITTAAAAGYSANWEIDGSGITEEWIGGSAPSAGGSDGFDIYTANILKTGSGAYKVFINLVNAT